MLSPKFAGLAWGNIPLCQLGLLNKKRGWIICPPIVCPPMSQINHERSNRTLVSPSSLAPTLIKSGIRVLIYNGDADSCVPYIGNEEWTLGMVAQGVVSEAQAWHPWYAGSEDSVPAGYATNYALVGGGGGSDAIHSTSAEASFSFVTMRLAGHEVPHYRPRAAYNLFERFLNGKAF